MAFKNQVQNLIRNSSLHLPHTTCWSSPLISVVDDTPQRQCPKATGVSPCYGVNKFDIPGQMEIDRKFGAQMFVESGPGIRPGLRDLLTQLTLLTVSHGFMGWVFSITVPMLILLSVAEQGKLPTETTVS